jgi:hypothetical protein
MEAALFWVSVLFSESLVTLIMEAVNTSEALVNFYQTTRRSNTGQPSFYLD